MSFFFPHTCSVKRTTGETDSNHDEIFEDIYIGECGYQPTNNAYNASGVAVLNSPNVILPLNEVVFQTDDIVKVTVEKERVITANVESFEDAEDSDCGGTTLWLKHGNG